MQLLVSRNLMNEPLLLAPKALLVATKALLVTTNRGFLYCPLQNTLLMRSSFP